MIEIERMVISKRPDCAAGIVSAVVVDSHRVALPLDPIKSRNAPETGVTGSSWVVPKTMPAGPAIYRSTVAYSCAPLFSLWPVVVDNPGIMFTVAGDDIPPIVETPATPLPHK